MLGIAAIASQYGALWGHKGGLFRKGVVRFSHWKPQEPQKPREPEDEIVKAKTFSKYGKRSLAKGVWQKVSLCLVTF